MQATLCRQSGFNCRGCVETAPPCSNGLLHNAKDSQYKHTQHNPVTDSNHSLSLLTNHPLEKLVVHFQPPPHSVPHLSATAKLCTDSLSQQHHHSDHSQTTSTTRRERQTATLLHRPALERMPNPTSCRPQACSVFTPVISSVASMPTKPSMASLQAHSTAQQHVGELLHVQRCVTLASCSASLHAPTQQASSTAKHTYTRVRWLFVVRKLRRLHMRGCRWSWPHLPFQFSAMGDQNLVAYSSLRVYPLTCAGRQAGRAHTQHSTAYHSVGKA